MPEPTIKYALDVVDQFINIARELAKLPQLVLPQYQAAAQDLYEISQKLLTANENLSRWLYKFLYFDFRQNDARNNFLNLVRDYKTMKQGPEFQQLKFSCTDISSIYDRNIASKLVNWFSSKTKLQEAKSTFDRLSYLDKDLVSFIYDHVISALDNAVDDIAKCIDASIDHAEMRRLQTQADMKDVTERLVAFAGALSDLVVRFASIAHVPVTLKHS